MNENEIEISFDDDPRPVHGGRQRLAMLALLVALGGVFAVLLAWNRDASEANDATDPDAEIRSDITPVPLDVAGPYDGLDSLGHPVAAAPDTGLVDGQIVTVHGSGFAPGAQVGFTQCRFREPLGGQNDCDLATLGIAGADGNGNVEAEFTVHRYVNPASGTFDCTQGTRGDGCGIGMGNLADYDDSGKALLFFDPASEGTVPPRIEVDPMSGLLDGQQLVVRGTGFVPGETASLTQCPVGGVNGVGTCFGRNGVGDIQVDEQGDFAVSVPALRVVTGAGGDVDCYTSPYPCLVIVQGSRMANTIPLSYDGGVAAARGPEFTVTPNVDLVDGQIVELALFDLATAGPVSVQQCVDQGPLGVSCGAGADAAVVGSAANTAVVVVQFIANADGEAVDCAGPGRTCFLRVVDDDVEVFDVPIHFRSP